jgi:hypothetical protein
MPACYIKNCMNDLLPQASIRRMSLDSQKKQVPLYLAFVAACAIILGSSRHDNQEIHEQNRAQMTDIHQVNSIQNAEEVPINKNEEQVNSSLSLIEAVLKEANPDLDPKLLTYVKDGLTNFYNSKELGKTEQEMKRISETHNKNDLRLPLFVFILCFLVDFSRRGYSSKYSQIVKENQRKFKDLLDNLIKIAKKSVETISDDNLRELMKSCFSSIEALQEGQPYSESKGKVDQQMQKLFTKLLDLYTAENDQVCIMIDILGKGGLEKFGIDGEFLSELANDNVRREFKLSKLNLLSDSYISQSANEHILRQMAIDFDNKFTVINSVDPMKVLQKLLENLTESTFNIDTNDFWNSMYAIKFNLYMHDSVDQLKVLQKLLEKITESTVNIDINDFKSLFFENIKDARNLHIISFV